jgi:hypothetical protein
MRPPAARIGQALQACQQALESLQASAISGHGGYGIQAGQRELPGQNVVLAGTRSYRTSFSPSRMTGRYGHIVTKRATGQARLRSFPGQRNSG